MIKTVFLDIDNTLLDFNECANVSAQKAFRDLNLTYHEGVFPVFTEENDKLWLKIEDGTITREELHRVRWQLIFDRLQIDADGILMEKLFLDYIKESPVLMAGALELLTYLSPRYTVCLASNAPEQQQLKRLAHTPILPFTDHIFLSEALGAAKPEKAFWDACFAQLSDASPETSIIIGDSLTADIIGGAGYGLKTCWFNPNHLPLPTDCKIDYVVHTLAEIKNIL